MEMINGDADAATLAARLLPKRERRKISRHLRKTLSALYSTVPSGRNKLEKRERVEKKKKRKNRKSKKKTAGCRLKEHVLLRKPPKRNQRKSCRLYSIHQRITSDTDLQVCVF